MICCTRLIFILCSVFTPALCCNWLRHYIYLSNKSLTLIQLMGGPMTNQESPIPFPYKLYKSTENTELEYKLVFIRDSLELISDLYHHDNRSLVTWDTNKTEHFLTILHRQAEELSQCVTTEKTNRRLRRYYKRLAAGTLYCTGGSSASWELIRSETKTHLQLLHLLVASILNPSAASRRRSASVESPRVFSSRPVS